MSFPFSPYDGQTYTNVNGTGYQYSAVANLWRIVSQTLTGGTGIQGLTGPMGAGFTGLQGIQGLTGFYGQTGIQGLGLTGLQGIQGNTGIQGLQGSQGNQGVQGIQGITGFYGQTGLQGITGFYGQTGIRGITGLALGATGVQGPAGQTGVQGAITGTVDQIDFLDISTSIPAQTYTIRAYSMYAATINTVYIAANTGSATGTLEINGTPVTGVNGVNILYSLPLTLTATGANTVTTGSQITFTVASTSSLGYLQLSIGMTRN
jgi:hypothetical protein